jgi:guanylate cyclase
MGDDRSVYSRVLQRFVGIGGDPTDAPEVALQKQTLILSTGAMAGLAVIWVVSYAAMGLWLSAAIPFAYQVISIVNLSVFARTKRFRFFRTLELWLSLLLPLALQLSLGGFTASSGIVLWSFTAPLGALMFLGRPSALRWFGAFLAVVAVAALLDPLLHPRTDDIPGWFRLAFFALNVLGVTSTSYLLLNYFVRERDRAAAQVALERERSERLLLNVLPEPIAERLKAGESVIADAAQEVGVLFADLVGFTPMSAAMEPAELVRLLDGVFSDFDVLADEHGLEKIKTIGDAYMVASGLLDQRDTHVGDLASMALDMLGVVGGRDGLALRIGIDVGPVVAGVIGRRKFIYDLWGDTVNTASRMESHGVPGTIHVTERARDRLGARFRFDDRGINDIKGKGSMRTFVLLGPS